MSRIEACLAALLILGSSAGGAAQSSPGPAQPPPAPQAPATAKPETEAAATRVRHRATKRTRRTSKRRTAASVRQQLEAPRGSRAPRVTREELGLTANMLGGYDGNRVGAYGRGASVLPTPMASGSTGNLEVGLGYSRGNGLRSIAFGTTGGLRSYPGYPSRPASSGTANVGARTTIGRRFSLGGSQAVQYQQFFNVFSPAFTNAHPQVEAQQSPAGGLFERHSISSFSLVSLGRQWNRRDSTSLSYAYRAQQFAGDPHGNNSAHQLVASYSRQRSHGIAARAEYSYTNGRYIDYYRVALPTVEHRIEAGPEIRQVLSRRRQLTCSVLGGAAYVQSVDPARSERYHFWVPTASAGVLFGVSPSWSVEGGYRRGFNLLQGVTDAVYTTDTAFLGVEGRVASRADLRLGGTYSNWKTSVVSGLLDTLHVYGATAQFRLGLTSTTAASAAYYYYRHDYSNRGDLPQGFPAQYDRHAIRFGLVLTLPLMGRNVGS